MKSMSAHIFKLSAENQGRTQKIQNSGRSVTTSIYRGVPGCGPLNFNTILYPIKGKICCYIHPINVLQLKNIYSGGNPGIPNPNTLDGGTPSLPGPKVLNGGNV
jgi:hypothetical protein